MNAVLPIAWLSFKEGLRHQVLFGILLFAFLFMSFTVLLCGLFMRDILKILLDLCLSAVSVGGLLVPFFLAINQLAGDFEQKTVYAILAQPVSRANYIIGKFLGLSFLTALIVAILTACTLAAVWTAAHVYPQHFFKDLSIRAILLAATANLAGLMVLNSIVVLWCVLTSGSFLATLLTIATYLVGHSVEDMVHFMSLKLPGAEVSPLVQKTAQIAMYLFPNLAVFDLKQKAAYGFTPPATELCLLGVYGVSYIFIMLCAAVFVFQKRELS